MFALESMAIAQQEMRRVARVGAGIFTVCLDMSLNYNGTTVTPMGPNFVADIEVTRAQNRNYALADGFPLFLRYKAQAERLYRCAVEEFDRVKALRDEFPKEAISDPQPKESKPASTPPEEPVLGPGEASSVSEGAPISPATPEDGAVAQSTEPPRVSVRVPPSDENPSDETRKRAAPSLATPRSTEPRAICGRASRCSPPTRSTDARDRSEAAGDRHGGSGEIGRRPQPGGREPATFTQDNSGTGQASAIEDDGTQVLVDSAHPGS